MCLDPLKGNHVAAALVVHPACFDADAEDSAELGPDAEGAAGEGGARGGEVVLGVDREERGRGVGDPVGWVKGGEVSEVGKEGAEVEGAGGWRGGGVVWGEDVCFQHLGYFEEEKEGEGWEL